MKRSSIILEVQNRVPVDRVSFLPSNSFDLSSSYVPLLLEFFPAVGSWSFSYRNVSPLPYTSPCSLSFSANRLSCNGFLLNGMLLPPDRFGLNAFPYPYCLPPCQWNFHNKKTTDRLNGRNTSPSLPLALGLSSLSAFPSIRYRRNPIPTIPLIPWIPDIRSPSSSA